MKRVAVIGAGVAGVMAAHLLQRRYDVTLIEKSEQIGGHTHTVEVQEDSRKIAVDTGFIVFNERNYPLFSKFLSELGVPSQKSNMSFSFFSEKKRLFYAGINFFSLFAQKINFIRPTFWAMLLEIPRFYVLGKRLLSSESAAPESLADFLKRHRFSKHFIENYLIPMGAAIWSTPHAKMLEFPAKTFIRFFDNHGLLSLLNRPQWRTILGGSHQYLKAFQRSFRGRILRNFHVQKIHRTPNQIRVSSNSGDLSFDYVVFAVHADQVLPLIEASPEEQNLFSLWNYNHNPTWLHSDDRLIPKKKSWRASWNYQESAGGGLMLTYYMNRLQNLNTPNAYCVSLHAEGQVNPVKVIRTIDYEHPEYTLATLHSQEAIKRLNGSNSTYYCGSYLGFGFHEDAVRSSVEVARQLGVEWP